MYFLERDFVLEPEVITTLLAFFQAGGQPETVIELLTDNYYGCGQITNLIGSWLADLEEPQSSESVADFQKNKDDELVELPSKLTAKIE